MPLPHPKLPTIAALWPQAKVIACVRDPAWCLDSVESLTRRNALEPSGIFKFDPSGTVYSRAEGLMSGIGMIGYALNALREAVFGAQRDRLLLVRFETLTVDPPRALAAIYDFIGEPPLNHSFDDIEPDYDAMMFDARIGAPGLHAVGPKVSMSKRDTILPPDLFGQIHRRRVLGLAAGPAGKRATGVSRSTIDLVLRLSANKCRRSGAYGHPLGTSWLGTLPSYRFAA